MRKFSIEPQDFSVFSILMPDNFLQLGTMQFMAPEVIDNGQRGYGPPVCLISFVPIVFLELIFKKHLNSESMLKLENDLTSEN